VVCTMKGEPNDCGNCPVRRVAGAGWARGSSQQ
jgi:hypothetical protein